MSDEPIITDVVLDVTDDRNADWTKQSLDLFGVSNVEELRQWIEGAGTTVAHFKTLPVYTLALASGKYPWLADL